MKKAGNPVKARRASHWIGPRHSSKNRKAEIRTAHTMAAISASRPVMNGARGSGGAPSRAACVELMTAVIGATDAAIDVGFRAWLGASSFGLTAHFDGGCMRTRRSGVLKIPTGDEVPMVSLRRSRQILTALALLAVLLALCRPQKTEASSSPTRDG